MGLMGLGNLGPDTQGVQGAVEGSREWVAMQLRQRQGQGNQGNQGTQGQHGNQGQGQVRPLSLGNQGPQGQGNPGTQDKVARAFSHFSAQRGSADFEGFNNSTFPPTGIVHTTVVGSGIGIGNGRTGQVQGNPGTSISSLFQPPGQHPGIEGEGAGAGVGGAGVGAGVGGVGGAGGLNHTASQNQLISHAMSPGQSRWSRGRAVREGTFTSLGKWHPLKPH
jgi:hypothetical protein